MLVLTSLEDVTADLVIAELGQRDVPVVRVDPADIDPMTGGGLVFAARIGADEDRWGGELRAPCRVLDLGRVRSVYHRRPSPWRFDHLEGRVRDFARREAQHGLAGVLFHLPIVHVNAPSATARAEYKPAQLQVAADLGFTIPATLITNDLRAAREFAADHGPVVYKSLRGVPPADGHTGAIWTQRIAATDLDKSVNVTAHLFQQEIDKVADARITVVGPRVFASMIEAPGAPLDWRAGDWEQLTYTPLDPPEGLREQLHAYLERFGLLFGCFDFAIDRRTGHLTFIECNPNGQWGFLPDADAIADAFASLLQAG
ncbi:ATP-grasp ribosomal peptide maturase [Actinomadura terrae]|uniref:ATP-grasp ribosomal peptide maturase n=1 Tax=Actinomadura terrae TaxID=604353 RepID=UPI001FA74075|nr:ATP-grasp ribosomal peptide maturase [Actinomadura terrae]